MKRIMLFDNEGIKTSFGTYYIHWLIEDCEDCFWCISNDSGTPRKYGKPRFSFEVTHGPE